MDPEIRANPTEGVTATNYGGGMDHPPYLPVREAYRQLTGGTIAADTLRDWARLGLPTIRGARRQILCTVDELREFLRARAVRQPAEVHQ
jgi:hypothetical protein